MNTTELKDKLLKDRYMEFAYKRYEKFKASPQYDEQYKYDVLEPLNEYMRTHPITKESVAEIALKLQSTNPQTGSFVHWSNTDSLVKFAESKPQEAADVWNQLYNDQLPIKDRIHSFRSSVQAFDANLAVGAPLFGYLLAAYDYTTYPPYKGEIYKEVKSTYQIGIKMGSVSENYANYLAICNEVLEYIQSNNPDQTMLDVQDFLYCSTRYDKVKVETAVDYLHYISSILKHYEENTIEMIAGIKALNQDDLHKLQENYRDGEKVRKIRFLILDTLLKEQTISIERIEEIKIKVSQQYETSILHSFNNFSILFHLYYFDKKPKVQDELTKIHQAIRHFDSLQNLELVDDKTMNGFNWNQGFGTWHCWLAVYETKYKTHRLAPQLYMGIGQDEIKYGLYYGDERSDHQDGDIDEIDDINQFTFEKLASKMNDAAEKMISTSVENKDDIETYISEDPFTIEEWSELLENDTIFKHGDIQMLEKMYELGGEAAASQLATAMGRHNLSFNSPVKALGNRIYEHTNIKKIIDEKSKIRYWQVPFNGREEKSGLMTWIMKENLYAAFQIYIEREQATGLAIPYTKDEFLSEVFIDEIQYDMMTDLLAYKKNMILEGPPGVGKTFVAKRLAHSIIGEQNDDLVEMIQFHQSYAYEDFIMGFRPTINGSFGLEEGVFYQFCQKATANPEENYYFIIDEINRGNLSKIFGELFMLMEGDKRDELVTLSYSKEKFTIPSNVYLIGTMNTADRSLAPIEIALRRRFSFVPLVPTFNEKWEQYLQKQHISDAMIDRIKTAMETINSEISGDFQLGEGYEIGHSFFTKLPDHLDEQTWFEYVMRFEIIPLLKEYYFDRPEKVTLLTEGL